LDAKSSAAIESEDPYLVPHNFLRHFQRSRLPRGVGRLLRPWQLGSSTQAFVFRRCREFVHTDKAAIPAATGT
jgi:hypothetical protein